MTSKIPEDIKQKWVDALRSGEYSQTIGHLHVIESEKHRYKPGYCCLGVLCDVLDKDEIVSLKKNTINFEGITYGTFDDDGGLLPDKVRQILGLGTSSPTVKINGFPRSLSDINDNDYNFEQIADIIEEQL